VGAEVVGVGVVDLGAVVGQAREVLGVGNGSPNRRMRPPV
jgi:hypothetical protein